MKYWEKLPGENLRVGIESEDGGWFIEMQEFLFGDETDYKLYEVPSYGGQPKHIEDFSSFEGAFEKAQTLT